MSVPPRSPAESLAARTLEVIAEDRRIPVPVLDGQATEADFLRARNATTALCFTLAEMDAHQLVPIAEYLMGILSRDPMRSSPLWEPHRVVLGLFLLALRDLALADDPDQVPDDLRPAWFGDAVQKVTDAIPTP